MSNTVQEKNGGENVTDENNTRKQWEDIDNHMRQINVWTDESYSPVSTSPCRGPVNARVQRTHYNQHYRRSEGDIQGRALDSSMIVPPPQSAPVLPEFEYKWEKALVQTRNLSNDTIPETRMYVPNKLKDPGNQATYNSVEPIRESDFHHNSENVIIYPHLDNARPSQQLNFANNDDTQHKAEIGGRNYVAPPFKVGAFEQSHIMAPAYSSGSNSPQLHSSTSSPSLFETTKFKIHPSSSNVPDDNASIHIPPYHQNPTKFNHPAMSKIVTSPNERRKSAPVSMSDALINRNRNPLLHRATTQPQLLPSGGISKFLMTGFVKEPEIPDVVEEEIDSAGVHYDGKDDDKEYTIVLLQHQSDRMHRLKAEYDAKQAELASLVKQVESMEAKLMQRNTGIRSSSPSTSLQVDVGRLRDINRKLEIDCNCMYKEVDLLAREGDSTRENFYTRYNRSSVKLKPKKEVKAITVQHDLPPPPLPPPNDAEDEQKWRCSHCTFDNHAALNKCEMCEFSRGVQPGRPTHP